MQWSQGEWWELGAGGGLASSGHACRTSLFPGRALFTNAISAVFITVIKLVKNKPLLHSLATLLVWY